MKIDWFMVVVLLCVGPVGIAFVLLWWKQADKWADAEHKRFKSKDESTAPRVIVKDEESKEPRS